MRKFLVSFLIFVSVFNAGSVRQREARAVAPVVIGGAIVTAEVAIVLMEALMAAATAAVILGIINAQQNDALHDEMQAKIDSINRAIASGVAVSKRLVEDAVISIMRTQALIHFPMTCLTNLILAKTRTAPDRRAGGDRRAVPREGSDRRVDNCSNFEDCCGNFRNRMGSFGHLRNGAFRIFKNSKHSKLQCCFEFDHQHKGLEIFDERGNHLGERGCDDDNADPCAWTRSRGVHAQPASGTHRPTPGKCG